MDTQTLQRFRTELEAASTLHLALGRIAHRAQFDAPTAWTGPLLEELEDLAGDDGSFSHASLAEIRRRSGAALVAQFHAVRTAVDRAPASEKAGLQALLNAVLVTGTQDASITSSPSITGVLASLARSAGLQLEATMRAAMLARDGLPPPPPKEPPLARKPAASKPAKKKAASKKPAPKKSPVKKPSAPKKPAVKKAPATRARATPKKTSAPKKPSGKKAPAKASTGKGKRPTRR
jgi:outer membrane biosynthesis protein TonB